MKTGKGRQVVHEVQILYASPGSNVVSAPDIHQLPINYYVLLEQTRIHALM